MLFEHAADAVYLCAPDGQIVEANEQASRATGYTAGELLRLRLTDLDSALAAKDAVRGTRGRFVPDQPLTLESLHRRKDGALFPVEVTLAPLQAPGGARVLAIVRDITQRERRAEEPARQFRAVTRPLDDVGDIAFEELLDLDDLQRLQDQYAVATGVASLITRPDGTPIT
jgi:PAS domain S-box-containing protein